MDKKEFELILEEGEGQFIEFKESFDKSLAKEIVAFTNSQGGRIFLGINDDKKVKGIKLSNELKSRIFDIARNCDPSINLKLDEFENVIVINVEEGANKPYQCSDGFFIRTGPNSQKLRRDEIINLIKESGKIRFDSMFNKKFIYPNDFDFSKLDDFLKKAGISKITKYETILKNLELGEFAGEKFKLNNAGILLFGKNVNNFIRQSFITCVLYKGKERVNVIDRKDFNNDILSNYEDAFAFLKKHLKLKYIIKGGGPRKEVWEIPEEALREALLNAVIHKDYFEEGFGLFVEIFDNRVEIVNNGKLLFDKKELGKISFARNPIIFDLFYRINLIEKIGSGINRIKELIKDRKSKVKFEINDFFRTIFYRPKEEQIIEGGEEKSVEKELGVKLGEKLGVKLGENKLKIIELISLNKFITIKDLSLKLGISEIAIYKNIEKLKQKGILRRIGPDKGGYWEIIKT